ERARHRARLIPRLVSVRAAHDHAHHLLVAHPDLAVLERAVRTAVPDASVVARARERRVQLLEIRRRQVLAARSAILARHDGVRFPLANVADHELDVPRHLVAVGALRRHARVAQPGQVVDGLPHERLVADALLARGRRQRQRHHDTRPDHPHHRLHLAMPAAFPGVPLASGVPRTHTGAGDTRPLEAATAAPRTPQEPEARAYFSSNNRRSCGFDRSSASVRSACPGAYPLPTIMVTSLPTPSAPRAA